MSHEPLTSSFAPEGFEVGSPRRPPKGRFAILSLDDGIFDARRAPR
jgi:hypothetical protein